jgi:acetyl-CoA synthetase
MPLSIDETWYPDLEQTRDSNIAELMNATGVTDYDELYRFSVKRPGEYWRHVLDYCGIIWSKPYISYGDFSAGKEFPRWFLGGELNWTDTIWAFGNSANSAGRQAVIAEKEDGQVCSVTYATLADRVRQFAGGLTDLGIVRGDRVGLLMEPGIEAVVTMLALSYVGAIVLPLFSGFGSEAVVVRLSSCGARALVATTGFWRRGRHIDTGKIAFEARERLSLEFLILKPAVGVSLAVPHAIDWYAVASAEAIRIEAARMAPHDPFMVIYTSGTTGKPKGTVHTHGGYPLKIAHDAAFHFEIKAGDVFFWPADMGWIAGALVITSSLMRGATMVCYDGAPDFPTWARMSKMVERHKVTHFASAPTMIRGLLSNTPIAIEGDTCSIRVLITGGESINPEHSLWFQRAFGRSSAPVINYTGGTEVSGALLSSVVVKPIRPGGFNTASPGVSVDVLNALGEPVVDEIGELAILEPFVGMTQSFWHDDARYLETYWKTIPGVWIHGDLAVRSSQGGFYLRGRSDDTIKLAGKRLGPAEVEEIVLELATVQEAAAIGVDDAVKGSMLVVFIVLSQNLKVPHDVSCAVANHVEVRLGRAFRPARVHIVRQLPKTRASKVMRRLIRSAYCGLAMGDLSSLENPAALDELANLAQSRSP